MSLFDLFNIGSSGMFASQAALSTTSNNIANMNTPGYSREEVILDISTPVPTANGLLGTGVTVAGVKRDYDTYIQSQMIDQNQNQGRSTALDDALGQVEQIFNEAQNQGLSASLDGVFNSWQAVASNPGDQTQRTALLQSAADFTLSAKRMESGMLATLDQINKNITDKVSQVNSLASQIAAVNGQIVSQEAGGGPVSSGVRDQRDNLMNQLSNLIEISSYENKDGSVTVMAGMRNLVSGEKTNTLSVQADPYGDNGLTLGNTDITSNITRGTLGGLLASRAQIEAGPLASLRKLAASVTKEVNLLHEQGYALDGSTGNDFFNPLQVSTRNYSAGATISASITDQSQLTLDEYTVKFDGSGNYSVYDNQTGGVAASGAYSSGNAINFDGIQVTISGPVSASDTFVVSPLSNAISNMGVAISDPNKVAAASTAAGLPGDNLNAIQIAQLANGATANLGGQTFSGFYASIVTNTATMSKAASDSSTFDNNLAASLKAKQQAASGVSLDEEAANLIKYQRSYEAGAKIISITDELLQTIMQL